MIAMILALAVVPAQDAEAGNAEAQARNLAALTSYVEAIANGSDGSQYLSAEPVIESYLGPDGERLSTGVASSKSAVRAYIGDCKVDPIKLFPEWKAPSSSESIVSWACADGSSRVATFRASEGRIAAIYWGAPVVLVPRAP